MSDRWNKTVTATQSAYCVCGKQLDPTRFPLAFLRGSQQRVCSAACEKRLREQIATLKAAQQGHGMASMKAAMNTILANQEPKL